VPCVTLDQKIQVWIAIGAWFGAIATFSAVVVSLWLAKRKPRSHLKVSVALDQGDQNIFIRIVNDGDTAPMVQKCELLSPQLKYGRIDIPVTYALLNNIRIELGVARLATGDWQEIRCVVHALGRAAIDALSSNLTEKQMESAMGDASISCVTTTGESFCVSLPLPVQQALVRSIKMQRIT
jgi:hypothetical protein